MCRAGTAVDGGVERFGAAATGDAATTAGPTATPPREVEAHPSTASTYAQEWLYA
jgi:hypothetical protein